MAQILDYGIYIKSIYKALEERTKTAEWKDDEWLIGTFSDYRDCIRAQIHDVLVPLGTPDSEKEIRDILSKYVIGYVDKKKKIVYQGALDWISSKLAQIQKDNKKIKRVSPDQMQAVKRKLEIEKRYEELKDDFMALASFRSMKHYFLYMQQAFGITVWEDTQNCFDGYWYYAGRMVLDGEVKFIEKQCPTGYGKSLSDAFMQSFIFGIDIDNDVLKVCGNDKFTDDCFQNVIKLMLSPKYAKVFPYYAQFDCDMNLMFQFCARKDLKFAITGSAKSTNFRIVTKKSDTNGVRAKYLFLDDITQRRDMSNITQHNNDIHGFTHEWFERNYNRNFFYVIASGTTYSQFDLLSHLKRVMGGEKAIKTSVNKYTYIGKSDYIVPEGISVFVCVPLLDYDTDLSTYPKKISTQSARKKREENPTEFWAMDMQRPMPPDSSPFYFTKLRQYTTLPAINECGRMETCVGALDTKRRGKDFLSMPIFFEANDPERPNESVFYLKDWLYEDRPMKECIPLVVAKIIQHKITRLYVERNTEECIETLLQDKLKEQGYTACVIEEVYSTEPKDRRIMTAEGDIKSKMIFPEYNMYAPSSDVGKALLNVYGYRYDGKVAHDDAPDSLALFAKRFIMGARRRNGSVEVLRL